MSDVYFLKLPMASQGASITNVPGTTFDLVLINASLAVNVRFNLLVIYDVPECRLAMLSAQIKAWIVFSTMQLPEGLPIKHLIHKVDPPTFSDPAHKTVSHGEGL
jgi:hypothetical protein